MVDFTNAQQTRFSEHAVEDQKPTEWVLYTHSCKNSPSHHLRKYAHWARVVKSMDITKTNGFVFVGDFLKVENEHKLPVGSVVVEVCGTTLSAYRITADGPEKLAVAPIYAMSLDFIKAVNVEAGEGWRG